MSELTRYAQSGDISIAYQVAGEGALDDVLVVTRISSTGSAGRSRVRSARFHACQR